MILFSCNEKGLSPPVENKNLISKQINITDTEFEKFMIYSGFDSDNIMNGVIAILDTNKLKEVKELNTVEFNILDFLNFRIFPNLEQIKVSGKYTIIDLSENEDLLLVEVYTRNNGFQKIDLTKNQKLETLIVSTTSNVFTKLDLSKNQNLKNLTLKLDNDVTQFELTTHKDIILSNLYLHSQYYINGIDELVRKIGLNAKSIYINSIRNQFETLDFSKMASLKSLGLSNLSLKKLIIPQNNAIEDLILSNLQIEEVDLSSSSKLFTVSIASLPKIKKLNINSAKNIWAFATLDCPKLELICINQEQKIDSFPSYPVTGQDGNNQHKWYRDKWTSWVICK